MNGTERCLAALRGEWPDRVPVILHNFQMAAREDGITMGRFRRDPRALADAFIHAVERYGYDGIIVDVDTVTLAEAAGVPVDLPEDAPARAHRGRLNQLGEVRELAPVDLRHADRVAVWLEACRLLVQHFKGEIAIRGNCDQCPFTLAALVRGMDAWMAELLDPNCEEDIHALLEHCTAITSQFLVMMADTGVAMLSNGDSTAGTDLISPRLYRRFALPYEQRVVTTAHKLGKPYILHICGDTGPIIEDMIATGADGLEIDYKTDMVLAHRLMATRSAFVGNIDPSGVLALGTPAETAQKTRALLELFADTPRFILNAGCALPPDTPQENLRAMITTAREFR
jgi:uroporphyrinogen decarboxylase